MKALQSGKNVRELTESDFSSLQESLLAQINFDISENVETSSETRISFLPGETTKTLNFRVLEDEESEGEEMFNFLLSPTDTHTVAVENNSSLSFIIEDDEPVEHSVVTFTADTFTAKDGILTVGISRETAEYSYITAGLKLTGINSAEKKEYEIAFQPFQKEVSVEIPVTQNSTEHRFTAEICDLKGGQEGSIMTAQAIVPVAAAKTGNKEAPDSYLDDFVDKKPEKGLLTGSYPKTVTIAGVNYNIEEGQPTGTEGSNYCNLKRNGSIVGRYIVPEIGMFGKTENGSGDHTTKMEDDGNPYLYMEYDSDWAWNYGWTCMTWDLENPNRYRALMMDVATGDNTNSSAVRLVLTANDDEPSSTAYTGSFSSIFNNPFNTFSFNITSPVYQNVISKSKEIVGKHERGINLCTAIFDVDGNNYKPYKWVSKSKISCYTERTSSTYWDAHAKIYGYVLLYREYQVNVQQPEKMSYRSGELNADGTPKMVDLAPAEITAAGNKKTFYYGEAVQFSESSASGNTAVYGEFKGYNITPLGGSTFFYATNESSFTLNDDMCELIDKHTSTLQKSVRLDQDEYLAYTTLTVQPVYSYKNVMTTILTPTGLPSGASYQYLDKDLENMRTSGTTTTYDVFHVGDRLNLMMTTDAGNYAFSEYVQKQYFSTGDTKHNTNCASRERYMEGEIPGWVLVYPKCEVQGEFSNVPNHITIEMTGDAQKYFTIKNLVPQSELTNDHMKGKNILDVSDNRGNTSKTLPVVGRAYTVELEPTDENDGTWRPVITISVLNQKVNGFAADFIAQDNYESNRISISAEKYDPSKYEYFGIDGYAYYEAESLLSGSREPTRSPAMIAVASAGGYIQKLYKGSGTNAQMGYMAFRESNITDEKGKFEIPGLLAMAGDKISVVIDNNDMQQVKYISLTKPDDTVLAANEDSYFKTRNFEILVADENQQKNVIQSVSKKCFIVNAGDINLPIRTNYSPYVSNVYFDYRDNYVSPYYSQLPIYESDELTLSAKVITNDAAVTGVTFVKVARNGITKEYSAVIDKSLSGSKEKVYSAPISGQDMSALDHFYVKICAIPKGGSDEIEYTSIYTGIEMYVPKEEEPTQYISYEIATPYDNLPILGDPASNLDSGTLNYQKVYADEENKATSAYARIYMASTDTSDERLEDFKKYMGWASKEAEEASKPWDKMMKDKESDVYKYLNTATQNSLYEQYKKDKKDDTLTKEDAAKFFNENPEAKQKYEKEMKKNYKKDAIAEMNKKKAEIKWGISVLLQLEYDYNPEKNTHFYSGGQYIIKGTASIEKTFYWSVGVIPVYLNIKGEGYVQLDGRYVTKNGEMTAQEMGYYENLTEAVESEWPYIELGLGVTLQPGVGICGVAGVRGMLKLAFVGRGNLDTGDFLGKGGTTGTFTGGVGIDLVVFSFDYEIGSIGWKTGCFDPDNLQAGMPTQEKMTFRPFNNGKEYKNENLRSTLLPDSKTTLISGAMEYIRPQLIDLGDGRTMLLFLRNMSGESRDESNASTLVYAIRNADGTWDKDANNNISSVVVENDNMADSTFYALKSGDKVYIAWTNAKVSADIGSNIESAKTSLQSSDIHMTVFDIPTETMGQPFAVTNDSFVNSNVILSKEENNIALYYFKRDIADSAEMTDLVGLGNNYNTWARKVYDPVQKKFIAVAQGKTNPEEELIVIEHPLVSDPMVTDLTAADYTYKNKNYRFYSYTVDRDGNTETVSDRELWLRVTNLTDNRDYYPIPIDAGKDSILAPELTRIENDVYLTWLSNNTTYNAISANNIFGILDNITGTGDYENISCLAVLRALSAEQISENGWYKIPYDSLGNTSPEMQNTLYKLSTCSFENNQKDFGTIGVDDKSEGTILNGHQLVAGGDGNLYLFWTEQPNTDVENDTGLELYGAALYRGEGEYSGWSDGIQLTNYGKVIDELTVSVGSDKGAILVGNLYSQEIGYDGKVSYSDNELAEIVFIPGNSLEFAAKGIVLSDYYPVEGEKVYAEFSVENSGLLPAEKYNLTVNGEKATVDNNVIYPGHNADFNAEFVAGKDGALSVSAEVKELGEVQELAVKDYNGNKTDIATKTGAVLEFGTPAFYTIDDVKKYLDVNELKLNPGMIAPDKIDETLDNLFTVSEPADERLKAVIADCVKMTVLHQDN